MRTTRNISILFVTAIIAFLCAIFAFSSTVYGQATDDYDSTAVFPVYSEEDFVALSAYRDKSFSDKTIRLYADIDCKNVSLVFSNSTDGFSGTFDGNGHALKNSTSYLFEKIGSTGVVQNLLFTDCRLTSTFALAQTNNGTVQNVSFYGTQTANKISGIVQRNNGTFSKVCSYLTLSTSGLSVNTFSEEQGGSFIYRDCGFFGTIDATATSGTLNVNAFCSAVGVQVSEIKLIGCLFAGEIKSAGCKAEWTVFTQPAQDCSALLAYFSSPSLLSKDYEKYYLSDGEKVLYDDLDGTQKTETISLDGQNYDKYFAGEDGYAVERKTLSHVLTSYSALVTKGGDYTDAKPTVQTSVRAFDDNYENKIGTSALASCLGANFWNQNNYYPLPHEFITGEGTALSPLLVDSVDDFAVFKAILPYGTANTLSVQVENDINFYGAEAVSSLLASLTEEATDTSKLTFSAIDIIGGNYTVYPVESIFGADYSVTGSDTLLYGEYGTHYGYIKNESETSVSGETTISGSGTKADPYVITNCGEWVGFIQDTGKNANGKYAVLGANILINGQRSHGNKLNLSQETLYARLNGCGYAVAGLADECLIGTVGEGATVENLTVDIYGESAINAVLCQTNNGTLKKVVLTGTQQTMNAFCAQNNGTISKCENYIACTNAFSASGTGSVEYGINYASACTFGGTGEGYTQTIYYTANGKYLLLDGGKTEVLSLDYLTLKGAEYDCEDVFGYEKESSFPSLRVLGKDYKEEREVTFTSLTSAVYDGTVYEADDFCEDDDITFTWEYYIGTEKQTASSIVDAGTYYLTFSFAETNDFLPFTEEKTFVISKASVNNFFTFSDLNFSYTGTARTASDFTPTNSAIDSLVSTYGATAVYTYTENGNAITTADILATGGKYKQTVTLSSKNYTFNTASKTRSINIEKQQLTVAVNGSENVWYNFEANYSSFTVSATIIGVDSGKTLNEILTASEIDYTDYLTSDYTVGSAKGSSFDVSMDMTGIVLSNYTLVMGTTKGTLTVTKAPIDQGDIVFYGATATTEGAYSRDYDGTQTVLTATGLPQGIAYAYSENILLNSGEYEATLTVGAEDENYIPLVLTVRATIQKIELTLTASSVTKEYGYTVDNDDFTYTLTGFVGQETAQSTGMTVLVQVDGLSEGSKPSVGSYDLKVSYTGGTDNYTVTKTDGVLTITKISLTNLYKNNMGQADKSFDNSTTVYTGATIQKELNYFTKGVNAGKYTVTYAYYLNDVLLPVTYALNAGTYRIEGTVTPVGESDYGVTVYTCTLTVTKKTTSIAFVTEGEKVYQNGGYTYSYVEGGTQDYKNISYFPYQKQDIPNEGEIVVSWGFSTAVHAKTYADFVTVTYAGDDNHLGCSTTATLTVTPLTANITLTRDYDYTVSGLVPIFGSFTVGGHTATELSSADFSFAYTDQFGNEYAFGTVVRDAGIYTATVRCDNTDYVLAVNTFTMEILPIVEEIAFGTTENTPFLSYVYGTIGTYNGLSPATGKNITVEIQEDYLIFKGYVMPDTLETKDIRFRLSSSSYTGGYYAGTYELSDGLLISPDNYRLTFKTGTINKVEVRKQKVSAVWSYGSEKQEGTKKNVSYAGRNLYSDFGCTFLNDKNVTVSSETLKSKVTVTDGNGDSAELYHAGTYYLKASIANNNYELATEKSSFMVVIDKVKLTFKVNNATVEKGESFVKATYTYSPIPLPGADAGVDISLVDGATIWTDCLYNPATAQVDDKYEISLRFSFTDYEGEVPDKNKGILTVVANTQQTYTLADRTYTYDGTVKTLTVGTVAEGVTVVYSYEGGSQIGRTNVGVYTVTAAVTYPSGRKTNSSAKLTIKKATPVIEMATSYVLYTEKTYISSDMIGGKAYWNDSKIQEVSGSFVLNEETILKKGEYKYRMQFVPTDTKNFNTVTGLEGTIYAFTVDATYFLIDGNEYEWTANGIAIADRITLELDSEKTAFAGERITLWQNGSEVKKAVIKDIGTQVFEVKFDGKVAYRAEFTIILKEDGKTPEKMPTSDQLLGLENLEIKGDVLYVKAGGGIVKLNSEYVDAYDLYVDGVKVGNQGIPLSASNGTVLIQIKKNNIGVYSKKYTIQEWKASEGTTDGSQSGIPSYIYIILGVVGGIIVLGGLGFAIFRKSLFR